MKQAYLAGLFALTTALIAHPLMAHAECFTAGEQCPDGSTFVGQSEDGKYALYAARCDAGQYWNGSQCEGKSAGLPWNDGTANWLNTSQRACDEQGGGGADVAERTEVVMLTDTVQLHMPAVQKESFVCGELKLADAEGRFVNVHHCAVLLDGGDDDMRQAELGRGAFLRDEWISMSCCVQQAD